MPQGAPEGPRQGGPIVSRMRGPCICFCLLLLSLSAAPGSTTHATPGPPAKESVGKDDVVTISISLPGFKPFGDTGGLRGPFMGGPVGSALHPLYHRRLWGPPSREIQLRVPGSTPTRQLLLLLLGSQTASGDLLLRQQQYHEHYEQQQQQLQQRLQLQQQQRQQQQHQQQRHHQQQQHQQRQSQQQQQQRPHQQPQQLQQRQQLQQQQQQQQQQKPRTAVDYVIASLNRDPTFKDIRQLVHLREVKLLRCNRGRSNRLHRSSTRGSGSRRLSSRGRSRSNHSVAARRSGTKGKPASSNNGVVGRRRVSSSSSSGRSRSHRSSSHRGSSHKGRTSRASSGRISSSSRSSSSSSSSRCSPTRNQLIDEGASLLAASSLQQQHALSLLARFELAVSSTAPQHETTQDAAKETLEETEKKCRGRLMAKGCVARDIQRLPLQLLIKENQELTHGDLLKEVVAEWQDRVSLELLLALRFQHQTLDLTGSLINVRDRLSPTAAAAAASAAVVAAAAAAAAAAAVLFASNCADLRGF
ncbi:hypothetical protein ACSSS7_001705 [Eimeria intestinalis]